MPRTAVAGCITALVGLLAVSACQGDSSDADAGDPVGGSGAVEAEDGIAGRLDAPSDSGGGQSESGGGRPDSLDRADLLTDQRFKVKTASVRLESDDIGSVLHDIDAVVTASRGITDSEDIQTDDEGEPVSADLVVRIPVEQFDDAVDAVTELGVLVRQQTFTEDVTTEVADIDSRVENAEDSLRQLRLLFTEAKDIRTIIALESQLHDREAELESLQAQQRVLEDQTSMSTISIRVVQPDQTAPTADDDRAGFLTGIRQGWDGLIAALVGLSHVVGLMIPILVLVLPIAWVGWVLVRRRRHPAT